MKTVFYHINKDSLIDTGLDKIFPKTSLYTSQQIKDCFEKFKEEAINNYLNLNPLLAVKNPEIKSFIPTQIEYELWDCFEKIIEDCAEKYIVEIKVNV